MRGCHGRSVEESVARIRVSQRKTLSGEYATAWRARGEEAGRVMRALFAEGKCAGCLNWGKRHDCIEKESCLADPDHFSDGCQHAKNFYLKEKDDCEDYQQESHNKA